MLQIVYASTPTDFSAPSVLNILLTARQFNTMHGITGALIYRDDIFLQLIEGDSVTVRNVMKRIVVDERHSDVNILSERNVPSRTFTNWTMYDDRFDNDRWSRAAVRAKHFLQMPTSEILAMFTRISDKRLKAV